MRLGPVQDRFANVDRVDLETVLSLFLYERQLVHDGQDPLDVRFRLDVYEIVKIPYQLYFAVDSRLQRLAVKSVQTELPKILVLRIFVAVLFAESTKVPIEDSLGEGVAAPDGNGDSQRKKELDVGQMQEDPLLSDEGVDQSLRSSGNFASGLGELSLHKLRHVGFGHDVAVDQRWTLEEPVLTFGRVLNVDPQDKTHFSADVGVLDVLESDQFQISFRDGDKPRYGQGTPRKDGAVESNNVQIEEVGPPLFPIVALDTGVVGPVSSQTKRGGLTAVAIGRELVVDQLIVDQTDSNAVLQTGHELGESGHAVTRKRIVSHSSVKNVLHFGHVGGLDAHIGQTIELQVSLHVPYCVKELSGPIVGFLVHRLVLKVIEEVFNGREYRCIQVVQGVHELVGKRQLLPQKRVLAPDARNGGENLHVSVGQTISHTGYTHVKVLGGAHQFQNILEFHEC